MSDTVIADPLNYVRTPRMVITSSRGVPFLVLVDLDTETVEFWDLRYPRPHFNPDVRAHLGDVDMPGQFTCGRFNLRTVTKEDGSTIGDQWSALRWDSGDPDWCIDGPTMHLVRKWLRFTRNRAKSNAANGVPVPPSTPGTEEDGT